MNNVMQEVYGPYLNQSSVEIPIVNDFKRSIIPRKIEDHPNVQKGNLSIEQMAFSFKLKDKTLFNETTETCEIFYKLVGFSVIEGLFPIELFGKNVTISNVMETKQQDSWCANADDEKLFLTNSSEFRIFTSSSNQYHVYLLDNERFYSTGFFFLTILYTPKNYYHREKRNFYDENDKRKRHPDFVQYNLTDVTSFMLMSNDDSNIETTFFMVIHFGILFDTLFDKV